MSRRGWGLGAFAALLGIGCLQAGCTSSYDRDASYGDTALGVPAGAPRSGAALEYEPSYAVLPVLSRDPVPDMYFRRYGVNPTVDTREERFSTFSVDVDTASYSIVRSYLERGVLPPEAAVRVEELVNSFDYGYSRDPGATFTVHAAERGVS